MRYSRTDKILDAAGRKYYKTKKYPDIPVSENDIYVITVDGDRLDLLSDIYYKDPNLWWVIASANPGNIKGSLFPEPGTQLRIPVDIGNIMNLFKRENK